MIFYNLTLLEKHANNDLNKFIALFDYHCTGKLPCSWSKYHPSKVPLYGDSFMAKPRELLRSTHDVMHKVQYIRLAAYRDYTLFKLYRTTTLPRNYYPQLNTELIKHNPLLTISPKVIHFRLEED